MANKVAPESFDFAEGSAPGTPDSGYVRVYAKTDGAMYQKDDAGTETALGGGSGDVVGPASATDNAFARFDGTTGKLLQNSAATLDDNGAATFPRQVIVGGGADEDQLVIKGNASQTNPLLECRDSSDIVIAAINHTGGLSLNIGNHTDGFLLFNDDAGSPLIYAFADSANIGIGDTATPDPAALIDMTSTTKGFLPPRMTSSQWSSISSKPDGLLAYDTDLDDFVGMKNGASSLIGSPYVADGITFTDPTAQTWTALNQGSGTYTEDTTNKRLTIVEVGDGSVDIRGWTAPLTTTEIYTFYVKSLFIAGSTSAGFCIGFRENATGEMHLFEYLEGSGFASGNAAVIRIGKWNSATSFNSAYVTANAVNMDIHWIRIEDDNTNRKIYASPDGIAWVEFHSVGRTDFLTADEIVFAVEVIATTDLLAASLLSLEVT